jgi:uncharacterized membrane protein (GlpM family)
MLTFLKIALSAGIILAATAVAKRFPSAAGLVGVMPLTGAMVLAWVYIENRGDPAIMQGFAKGALLGIVPTFLFFLSAYVCVRKGLPLAGVLAASFGVWLGAAVLQQWAMK